MCQCVRLALQTLPDQNASKCSELEVHEGGASRNDTLESSVPPTVAAEIRKSLLGTKYEWMLDLEAMDWPEDIEPEVPVPLPAAVPTWGVTHQHLTWGDIGS